MFLRPILLDVLVDSFYYGKKAIGIVFADKFGDAMPLSAIALALTAVRASYNASNELTAF
jgi:hypothetical protein